MSFPKIDNPLNPSLYDFLWSHTGGKVSVINKGQPLQYNIVERNGRRSIFRSGSSGEEYALNCPICGDTRGRCYINHTFGTWIEGIPIYHLAHCHNEDCDSEISTWLREEMKGGGKDRRSVPASKGEASPPFDPARMARDSHERHEKLSHVQSLSVLPPDHSAVKYVVERGFEVSYLCASFNVGFFKANPYPFNLANGRLIIPIMFEGLPVGWIARVIPGYTSRPRWMSDEPPKYYFSQGIAKANFLYNYDQAKDADVIAVVEGPTDVWKVGTWGMALFGKAMSSQQCQLLCRAAENRGAGIVLLGDASTEKDNAAAAWEANYQRLRAAYRYPKRVYLYLFKQGDPGDCSPQELHDLVYRIVHGR